jgi:hypothetical protein
MSENNNNKKALLQQKIDLKIQQMNSSEGEKREALARDITALRYKIDIENLKIKIRNLMKIK